MREEAGIAAAVLECVGITAERVRAEVLRTVGWGEAALGQIPFTPRASKILDGALREALHLGHNYIGTEHLLLGLLREEDAVGTRILLGFDADPDEIQDAVVSMLLGPAGTDQAARQAGMGAGRADAHAGAAVRVRADYWPRLPDVRSLSGEEIDRLIDELTAEALRISCRRRVLADQLDVLRTERQIRRRQSTGSSQPDHTQPR